MSFSTSGWKPDSGAASEPAREFSHPAQRRLRSSRGAPKGISMDRAKFLAWEGELDVESAEYGPKKWSAREADASGAGMFVCESK